MRETEFYLAQRVSALVMVPLVLGHLALMIYAIQDGLTAEEILSRTRGSLFWGLYYSLFVVAVAVHAAIGLATIAEEWLGLRGIAVSTVRWAVFLALNSMGARAVLTVTLGSPP
ncbi:MAG: succinate dehydrogenase [Pseudomonadota bacterium]